MVSVVGLSAARNRRSIQHLARHSDVGFTKDNGQRSRRWFDLRSFDPPKYHSALSSRQPLGCPSELTELLCSTSARHTAIHRQRGAGHVYRTRAMELVNLRTAPSRNESGGRIGSFRFQLASRWVTVPLRVTPHGGNNRTIFILSRRSMQQASHASSMRRCPETAGAHRI